MSTITKLVCKINGCIRAGDTSQLTMFENIIEKLNDEFIEKFNTIFFQI